MNKVCSYIERKSLLYKTGVEYGDYTINHVEGCSHGCLYPCYAMLMAKRFGKVKTYEDWIRPKIVSNSLELLQKEIPKYRDKIKFVHLSFSTDPFMHGYKEISNLTLRIIEMLNNANIRCTALTKGTLPAELSSLSELNEFGITLISLDDKYRKKYEPFSAPYKERIRSLYALHKKGVKTWVSIEPYPTPNILDQDFREILESIAFVDKIIFGRLNYNSLVTKYLNEETDFYDQLSRQVIGFCQSRKKGFHIKHGTMANCPERNKKGSVGALFSNLKVGTIVEVE
ncbi:MAG: radical SAM protein [Nitrospinae bacterium]|nr:radical SAM protein [Nitrospinota bacterium]